MYGTLIQTHMPSSWGEFLIKYVTRNAPSAARSLNAYKIWKTAVSSQKRLVA